MKTLKSFQELVNMDPLEKVMEQKIAEIDERRAREEEIAGKRKYREWKKMVMSRSF